MTAATPARRRGNFMPFAIVITVVTLVFILLALGRSPWDDLFINPLINALIFLDIIVLGEFGLAILLFTLILRVATIPFTIRQLESTRAMQVIQPQMQEMQKKYKDPKRRQEEMLKLYREHNINPLGCFMPLLIQMVVFIALYRALVFVVGGSPESLVGLSQRLYPFPMLQDQIPLDQHFLWLNLGHPDKTFALPILVGLSTYLQQKMSVTPNASPQMQQQQQMMTFMMPLMLMFITLNLPSGVGVYWVASNVFSLFASYYVYGKRVLSWRQLLPLPPPQTEPAPAGALRGPSRPGKEDVEADYTEIQDEAEPEGQAPASAAETRSSSGKRRSRRKKRR